MSTSAQQPQKKNEELHLVRNIIFAVIFVLFLCVLVLGALIKCSSGMEIPVNGKNGLEISLHGINAT